MIITAEHLMLVAPKCPAERVQNLAEAITWGLEQALITNLVETAAFLGQAALETWHFKYFKEVKPRGQPDYFLKYERGKRGRNLGNIQTGDGARFCGHGMGMITGRLNTLAFWEWLVANFDEWRNIKLEDVTRLMSEDLRVAVLTAIWYWLDRGCGKQAVVMEFGPVPWRREVTPADCATLGYRRVTRTINGGYNHEWLRIVFYLRALQALGVEVDLDD